MRYDHIHWSIINDNPLKEGMGTISDDREERNKEDDGKVVLLGRGPDGCHHTLDGPLTKEEYYAKMEVDDYEETNNSHKV